ncbi:hypothetical protein ABZ260_20160 [Streptosporangium sp. NPDC006013]
MPRPRGDDHRGAVNNPYRENAFCTAPQMTSPFPMQEGEDGK